MRKNAESKEEIYLVSLDTFMLMAVMGITIGVLFVIVNPIAKPPDIITFPPAGEITIHAFNRIWDDSSLDEIGEVVTDSLLEILPAGKYRSKDDNSIKYYNKNSMGVRTFTLLYGFDNETDLYNLNYRLTISTGEYFFFIEDAEEDETKSKNEKIMNEIGKYPVLNENLFGVQ